MSRMTIPDLVQWIHGQGFEAIMIIQPRHVTPHILSNHTLAVAVDSTLIKRQCFLALELAIALRRLAMRADVVEDIKIASAGNYSLFIFLHPTRVQVIPGAISCGIELTP